MSKGKQLDAQLLSRLDITQLAEIAPTIASDCQIMAHISAIRNRSAGYQLQIAAAFIRAIMPVITEKAALTRFQDAAHASLQRQQGNTNDKAS